MTIKEKQQVLNQLKDDNFFEADKTLFISLFPRSPLNRELLRVNSYNRSRLHSNILYQLLGKCSKEDILKARNLQEDVEHPSELKELKTEIEELEIEKESLQSENEDLSNEIEELKTRKKKGKKKNTQK